MPDYHRFPEIPISEATPEQQHYIQTMIDGPRGAVTGPFTALCYTPELANRIQKIGEFLRFDSTLADDLRELVILLIARHWKCHYEWHYHAKLARETNQLHDADIESIRTGGTPATLNEAQKVVYQLCVELQQTKHVSEDTFQQAAAFLGRAHTLEIVSICGYYTLLAMVLNTAQIMPEEGTAF